MNREVDFVMKRVEYSIDNSFEGVPKSLKRPNGTGTFVPSEEATKTFLMSSWRSGSSLLGNLLASIPGNSK